MARVRFLHAADVHVALREREYCLKVVDEVAEVEKDAGVDFVRGGRVISSIPLQTWRPSGVRSRGGEQECDSRL
mgnify:CR=1 FL=1